MQTWHEMKAEYLKKRTDAMRHLAGQGMSKAEAARILGISLHNLHGHAKRAGVAFRETEKGAYSREYWTGWAS